MNFIENCIAQRKMYVIYHYSHIKKLVIIIKLLCNYLMEIINFIL